MNILFTCAGRRNYLINYFKEAIGDKGFIYAADMQLSAPALVDAHKAFIVPGIYEKEYVRTLLDICIKENVKAVISLNDLELPILAKNRLQFEKLGVRLIISSERVIDITFDKFKTFQFAQEISIATPATYITFESAKKAIRLENLKFPLVLKPRWGSASIGIEIVQTEEELELAYRLQIIKLERTILSEASKSAKNEAVLIQEYIKGQEYGVDIINDLEGNYKATIVKKKLSMRAGETDKAMTVDDANLRAIGKKIGKVLQHVGNLDCDFFLSNGKYYLLEMNSRFGGGYPFSHESGVDIPKAIVNWIEGKETSDELFKPIYNIAFSKYDNLMRIPSNNE
ncbi:ATP-grasp domain-containing protein [Bacteroidota bacterium]